MKALIRLAALAVLVLGLPACIVVQGNDGADGRDGVLRIERENRLAIESLRLGMELSEVQAAMPHRSEFSEAFTIDGVSYRALFYRTQRVEADGMTSRDETTPLVFADGALVGWGESVWREVTGR